MDFIVDIVEVLNQSLAPHKKLILSRLMRKCVFARFFVDAFYLIDFDPYCYGKQTAHCHCIHSIYNATMSRSTFALLAHQVWRYRICDCDDFFLHFCYTKEMINWWTHVWQTYRLCHPRRYVRLHRECHRGRPCRSHRPHQLYLFIDCVFIYMLLMTDNLATPKLPGTPSNPGSPGIPSRPSNPGLPGMLKSNKCNWHFMKYWNYENVYKSYFPHPFGPLGPIGPSLPAGPGMPMSPR